VRELVSEKIAMLSGPKRRRRGVVHRAAGAGALASGVALAGVGFAPDAVAQGGKGGRAAEAEACFSAAEAAQPLMREHKLRAAHRQLSVCARDVCPKLARVDCRRWLDDVTRALPKLVFVAREEAPGGETRAVSDVRVSADGEALVDRADGAPVPIDPGVHVLRFEHAGFEPVEQRVEVAEGQPRREVNVVFRAAGAAGADAGDGDAASAPPAAPPAAAPAPSPPAARPSGAAPASVPGPASIEPSPDTAETTRSPLVPIALTAAAGVAVGVGVYLEASGLSDRAHLENTCKPTRTCAQSDVDAARSRVMAGDIVLGAGALLFAGAAYVYFTRGTAPSAAGSASPSSSSSSRWGLRLGRVAGSAWGAALEGSL
jgi:hypothetical protein